MKKILSVLLVFLMLFTLAGCSGESKSKKAIIGVWKIKNPGTDEIAYIEVTENKLVLSDGMEDISFDCTVEEDAITLIDGDEKIVIPYTVNEDKSISIDEFDLEKTTKADIEKEQKAIIKAKEEAEKKAAEEAAKYESITIDLSTDYLKYKTITLDDSYIKEEIFWNRKNSPTFDQEPIEGIEIYGYYRDYFTAPENFEKYKKVIYNIPTEIDGLPVISVIDLETVYPANVSISYTQEFEYNIPDSTILISGINGTCNVSNSLKYLGHCEINMLPSDLLYWDGTINVDQKEFVIDDRFVLGYANLRGNIDTVIINDFNKYDQPSIWIGNEYYDSSDAKYNKIIKNVIYNVKDNSRDYATIGILSNKLVISDDSCLSNYINLYKINNESLEIEIGNNIQIVEKYPYPNITWSYGINKITNYAANLEDLIGYKQDIVKETEIYNKSGAVIDWSQIISGAYDCEFETGKLDFGNYYVEVKK